MASPASLRQRLRSLLDEHGRLFDGAFERTPLWRGLVHVARRRCGKSQCRCARGELHASTVLVDRSGSRRHNRALAAEEVLRFGQMTEDYRRLRRDRARAVAVQREILAILDALEEARRADGVRRHAHRLVSRD